MSGRSCSRATRVFFDRDADPAKEAAHHRSVGFDGSLGQKAIANRLKRDVRRFGAQLPENHGAAPAWKPGGRRVLIPEEAAPQFRDDCAPRNGMMPPPNSEMISPPITE